MSVLLEGCSSDEPSPDADYFAGLDSAVVAEVLDNPVVQDRIRSTTFLLGSPVLSPASQRTRSGRRPRHDHKISRRAPNRVVLETLERLERLICSLQNDILALVTEMHFRGASWSEIARQLGRTRQCTHQRYQPRMHAHATHELLRQDPAQAWRRARARQLHGGTDGEVAGA